MKCPCCETEVGDREVLVSGDRAMFSDGRVVEDQPGVLEILAVLVRDGTYPTKKSRSTTVQVNRLRETIRLEGLPYEIRTDKNRNLYVLHRTRS